MSRRRHRLLRELLLLGLFTTWGLHFSVSATPSTWRYLDELGDMEYFTCDNVLDGGAITGDARGCANPTFQANTITNVTLPSGGSGDLEFAWMMTTTDPASGQPVSWAILPNTNTLEYTPQPAVTTVYYMRCARRAGCTEYAGESNYVTIEIDCCENVTDGGAIDGAQTNCGLPYDPSLISNPQGASGGANLLRYAWYTSTTSAVYAPGDAAWTLVDGVSTPYYDPPAITETTHYVRVAQRQFCDDIGAWSNVVTVDAYPIPTLKADVTDVTCFGGSDGTATVTIVNAAQPFTAEWVDDPAAGLIRTGLVAGTYQFRITDNNGCATLEEVVIAEPNELSISIAQAFDACAFADDATLTTTTTGGTAPFTYAWADALVTTTDRSGLAAGTYDVTVTDALGCTATASSTIAPPSTLAATTTEVEPTCYAEDGSISVTVTGGTPPFAYAWTGASSTGATATDLGGGTYTCTVTDANNCQTTVSVSFVDVNPLSLSLAAADISCNGEVDGSITSSLTGGVAPYSYAWTNSLETTANLTSLAPNDYTLTVTDANGCTIDATATVTEPNALQASVAIVQPLCAEDRAELTASMSGGTEPYTYSWGIGGLDNTPVITVANSGDVTLTVVDANGCTASATVTIDALIVLELSGSMTPASCPGTEDGTATVLATGGAGGYTYLWNDNRAQTTSTATQLEGGNYTVTVEDARGCIKTFDIEVTNQSTGPIVQADLTQLDCFGDGNGEIDLTVTGGLAPYTFSWTDNGATTEDRVNLVAGDYEVTVIDAAGCESVSTHTIDEPVELECTARTTTLFNRYFHVSRFGGSDGATTVDVIGGAGGYTYLWDDPSAQTNQDATGLTAGMRTVTVTDANGCECQSTIELIEPSMISDFVWEDENGDGIQNPGEPGLAGVSVILTGSDFNGFQVNEDVTTDASGAYRFDQLPIGNYVLIFETEDDDSHLFSPALQGSDRSVDSDLDVFGAIDRSITAHGVGDFDTDAGFIPRESVITIGDRVWYDENHDGLQDLFELGLQGVEIRLIREADVFTVGTTRSNENGEYEFVDVPPGSYYLEVDQGPSSVASTFDITQVRVGTDINIDSDIDPITRRGETFTVTAATVDIDNFDVGLHESCPSVDSPGAIEGDESVCRGDVPSAITSLSVPSGPVSYQWIRANTPTYQGPNDDNWEVVPGATASTYQPGGLNRTWYYVRRVRVSGCNDFTGVSNVITKTVTSLPNANISFAGPRTFCRNAGATFSATAVAGATYTWDFGADATPATSSEQTVTGVTFGNAGTRIVTLTVTNANGCSDTDDIQINTRECFGPGDIMELVGSTQSGINELAWEGVSYYPGSYFEVERSDNGAPYTSLDRVESTSLGAWQSYRYEDAFAPSGNVMYRITHRAPQAEDGGRLTTELLVDQVDLALSAFPNPATDRLTVTVAAADTDGLSYELLSPFGQVMQRGALTGGRRTLDLQELSPGTYYLRVITQSGATELQTLFKR